MGNVHVAFMGFSPKPTKITEGGSLSSNIHQDQLYYSNVFPKYLPKHMYTYPSEKYESQMEVLFPILNGKMNMFQTTNQYSII